MFRSTSRVFFLLICATGTTAAMAANEKIDIDQPILLCMDKGCSLAFTPAVNDFSSCLGNQYTTACYGGDSTYGNVKAYSCVSCPSGYTLTKKWGLADSGSSPCNFSYYECEEETCNLRCPLIISRWRLASERGNYESSYITRLNEDTCTCDKIYSYRCAAGYYNSRGSAAVVSSPSSLNCVRCPRMLDSNLLLSYGTSDAGRNVGEKSCYMSKGDSYSHKVKEGEKTNTIGKYRLSVDCYYDQPSN
ncbi:MAG TPA: hypothetical protein DEA31_03420 [Alphaproteobacteria bacterium]|nr:hypothetical protein [Alphaproteobacteria bacterium]